MAERSKVRVRSRSHSGIRVSNPAGGMDVCVVLCVVQYRQKVKMQHNQDAETSTDEVQRENKRIKKS